MCNLAVYLELKEELGKGRPCVSIYQSGVYGSIVNVLNNKLAETERVLCIEVVKPFDKAWKQALSELRTILAEQKIRNASYVGVASGSSLALQQAIEFSKEVRRLAIVDGTTRPIPNFLDKTIDLLESSLPLGLPFRKHSEHFDAKPYLQRVRCPALVVTTDLSTTYIRAEAERMLERLPSAWSVHVTRAEQELRSAMQSFLNLNPKCPQKALAS